MAKIRRYAAAPSSAARRSLLAGLGDERRRRAEFGGGLRDRSVHVLEFDAAGHRETIGDPGEFRCDGVHRGAVAQTKLARHEVDRLDAVGPLVDRENPRVAEMLRGAGLLDVAGAAMDLDAERGDLDRGVGANRPWRAASGGSPGRPSLPAPPPGARRLMSIACAQA